VSRCDTNCRQNRRVILTLCRSSDSEGRFEHYLLLVYVTNFFN
jgi:hypothetical protein